jgi:hypothetical protein
MIGVIVWAVVVDVLHLGRPLALVALLGFVLASIVILRPLPATIGRPQEATGSLAPELH